jgi:AAT family amino acid transporter
MPTIDAREGPGTATARPRPWFVTGMLTLGVVVALSLASWYLLVDPQWSPHPTYPFPCNAVLFWAILSVVFLGFNLEFCGFDRLKQPVKGLAIIAATLTLAIGITTLLAAGLGHFDARFAADRKDGTGYLAGALIVLFGFFTFVTVVVNWEHWPWTERGLRQPKVGLLEIGSMLVPTLVLYLVLGLPAMAIKPGHTVLPLNTVIGWFYSIIVAMLVTALMAENWPWRLAGPGWRTAAASVIGNVALGTIIYFAFLGLAKALIGSKTVHLLGPAIHGYPAQLGVCWVFWMIFWSNACGNVPNTAGAARNYVARIGTTSLLGIGTFLAYYHFVAGSVLHEPVAAGNLHGNALGFINWVILWTLFYVVCLESYGLCQPEADSDTDTDTTVTVPAPAPVEDRTERQPKEGADARSSRP